MTALATETTRLAIHPSVPSEPSPAGSQLPAPTKTDPTPIGAPSEREQTTRPTNDSSTPKRIASAGSNTSPQAIPDPMPTGASPAGTKAQPTATGASTPIPATPSAALQLIDDAVEADPAFLTLLADVVDDLERVRIANENRLRHLTRDKADSDGEVRGLGLDARNPHVRRITSVVAQITAAEHDAVLALQNLMRKHPLGPWVKATVGVGEKQAARLLAAIGDPYVRPELVRADGTVEPSRPRTVSELWAYCGLHVLPASHTSAVTQTGPAGGNQTGHPGQSSTVAHIAAAGVAPKRQKGQRANWSTLAKTRAYLVAESCIKKAKSPLRPVYDETRTKYADAVHQAPCVRCGPAGKPASVGSPLSDGHKHARAMRAVSKELLKQLWRESKRLHETGGH